MVDEVAVDRGRLPCYAHALYLVQVDMTSPENTNAPPSRVSTSDSPQAGPVPLFDQHLKYLQDSYLSFFLERFVPPLRIMLH